jgi:hypothetical protein
MAFDMAEHLSQTQLERFAIGRLAEAELIVMANHLATCDTCHQGLAETLRRQRGSEGVSFTLAPEFWIRHEHLDFDQLVALADNKLDTTDREIIDTHLNVCATCREDVHSFLAFRKEIEPELRVRYGPHTKNPPRGPVRQWNWWQGIIRRPVYATAVLVLIAVAFAIAVMVFRTRTNVFEAWKGPNPQATPKPTPSVGGVVTAASPTTTPPNNESASNSPTPTIEPSPKRTIENPAPQIGRSAVLSINDGRSTITLNKDGRVTGFDDVPPETKRDIATALVAEKIETPAVLNSLSPESITLRGNGNKGAPFTLVSPGRTVIIENSPVFKWEQLSGASAYRVYVLDSRGRQAAKSEDLTSAITEWKPDTTLDRGKIYSWVVIAVVDGKEIVSPGAAAPPMKFQVLSANDLQKLDHLKRTGSYLVLGVFYAKIGLLAEAEREFQELARLNPDDKVAKKLLRSVRLIRDATR